MPYYYSRRLMDVLFHSVALSSFRAFLLHFFVDFFPKL
jgi:hypothetical protein